MPGVQDATLPTSTDYDPNQDFRSGNSLIHGYLLSKGLAPTAENVRRALEANAQNPGLIHNDAARLYNGAPPAGGRSPTLARGGAGRDVPAPAASAAAAPTSGGGEGSTSAPPPSGVTGTSAGAGGGPAGAVSGGGPARSAVGVDPAGTGDAAVAAGAVPPTGIEDNSGVPLWQQILNGLGVGVGMYGAHKLMGLPGSPGMPATPGVPAVNVAPPGGMGPTQGPVSRMTMPENDMTSIIPQIGGPGNRLPSSDMRLLGYGEGVPGIPAPAAQIGAPLPQIAGPPGPGPDTRPVANPNEAIPQPGPASAAIDKAVEGDPAPPRAKTKAKSRARGARVRVPG